MNLFYLMYFEFTYWNEHCRLEWFWWFDFGCWVSGVGVFVFGVDFVRVVFVLLVIYFV